jgi:enoyl-CoA hydratase/carnithine racemase
VTAVASTVDGHVAVIRLDPAEGRHDRAFIDALAAAAEAVGAQGEVRAVIMTGRFGTGWADAVLREAPSIQAIARAASGIEAVAAIPQPVIAAMSGPAHSAGLELALACDIRIADVSVTCAMPETATGLMPLGGGTQRLPRAIGRAAALRLLLLGEETDATEALRIGLVSRVVAEGEVDAAAHEIAGAIAERGPLATRMAKEAVHRGSELTLDQALRYELDLTVILQSTADRAEGVQAFIERRQPRFTGE